MDSLEASDQTFINNPSKIPKIEPRSPGGPQNSLQSHRSLSTENLNLIGGPGSGEIKMKKELDDCVPPQVGLVELIILGFIHFVNKALSLDTKAYHAHEFTNCQLKQP